MCQIKNLILISSFSIFLLIIYFFLFLLIDLIILIVPSEKSEQIPWNVKFKIKNEIILPLESVRSKRWRYIIIIFIFTKYLLLIRIEKNISMHETELFWQKVSINCKCLREKVKIKIKLKKKIKQRSKKYFFMIYV